MSSPSAHARVVYAPNIRFSISPFLSLFPSITGTSPAHRFSLCLSLSLASRFLSRRRMQAAIHVCIAALCTPSRYCILFIAIEQSRCISRLGVSGLGVLEKGYGWAGQGWAGMGSGRGSNWSEVTGRRTAVALDAYIQFPDRRGGGKTSSEM
ncbi:hypothetical protein BDV95DRAFT_68499 [Massariosphaeria phaeospora]|uniref:Uncharacterized protein n=1 Tax=Massariosphaeria phaeospora TaxID=100035 RepID=A0A7C8I9N2_9PLEO|nr:hypothetical protein BDV95DRAFT_68499 [Massariosphaeria phaeospora]